MKNLKQFSESEQKTILKFTEFLVDRTQDLNADFSEMKADEGSLIEAEQSARAYAKAKNNGKRFHSDFGASDSEKEIVQGVRDWIRRQKKRGHGKRN